MKKLFLLLIVLVPISSFSQSNGTWSISSNFQSDYNFVQQNSNDIYYISIGEPMWERTFQFTSGVGISYRTPSNLEFSTGIRYSLKHEELTGYTHPLYCGTVDYALLSYAPIKKNYIEIPLLARYYFLPGPVKMHIESGWIGSYQITKNPDLSNASWLIGAQAGVGVNYFLNRWQFGIGANYRFQHQMGERSVFYGINPHAFGFEFKTAFSLNN